MDRRWRRVARWSKTCWRAAKGALSSSGADTVVGAVFDDASTNSRECGGVRVLPVDDKAEVTKVGCKPTSLSIWAGMVVPESVWGQLKLSAGDDGVRVLPSRSEGLKARDEGKAKTQRSCLR